MTIVRSVLLSLAATALVAPARAEAQTPILAAVLSPRSASARAADVLAQSRAAYAAMQSYADTGAVIVEYGSDPAHPSRDTHRFRTWFRRPRRFLFDFRKEGGDQYVVWGDDQAFHSWWKTTGVQYDYPKGQGSGAFSGGSVQTKGSILMIPPLLFAGAGLAGPLTQIGDVEDDGKETVAGHECLRLVGVAKDVYPSGKEVNIRKVIVWVDAKSMLVRKVFEDAARGSGRGVSHTITIFEPQAEPKLADAVFAFTPPDIQH